MHDKGVKSGNDMLLPPWMLPVLMEGLGSNWPGCTTTPTGVVICAGGAAVASTAQGASCMLHRREISSGVLVGVLHKAGSELKASRAGEASERKAELRARREDLRLEQQPGSTAYGTWYMAYDTWYAVHM